MSPTFAVTALRPVMVLLSAMSPGPKLAEGSGDHVQVQHRAERTGGDRLGQVVSAARVGHEDGRWRQSHRGGDSRLGGDRLQRCGSQSRARGGYRGVGDQALTVLDDGAVGQGHVDEVVETDERDAERDRGDRCRHPARTPSYVGQGQAAARPADQQQREPDEQFGQADQDRAQQRDGDQEEQAGEDGEEVYEVGAERNGHHQVARRGAAAQSAQAQQQAQRVDEPRFGTSPRSARRPGGCG